MSRATLVLNSDANRAKAVNWIRKAPQGSRVEFKGPQRSIDQNSRMWAQLTDIATQVEHHGMRFKPDVWKVLLMHAFGKEIATVPSVDGKSLIPLGYSSSKLSKAEMSEFQEFISAWGAENGVVFSDPNEPPARSTLAGQGEAA